MTSGQFDAPWQAEAFALAVALNEAGLLDWSEWAEVFSAELAAGEVPVGQGVSADAARALPLPSEGDAETQAAYYRAWLAALERISRSRGWIGPLQLAARRETLRAHLRVAEQGALFSGDGAER